MIDEPKPITIEEMESVLQSDRFGTVQDLVGSAAMEELARNSKQVDVEVDDEASSANEGEELPHR